MYTECLSVYLGGKLSFSEKNTWFVGVHVSVYICGCICVHVYMHVYMCYVHICMCLCACGCVCLGTERKKTNICEHLWCSRHFIYIVFKILAKIT